MTQIEHLIVILFMITSFIIGYYVASKIYKVR